MIGSRHQLKQIIEDLKITIGGMSTNRVHSTKSLGIIIDEKLKWDEHIDRVSKEVSKGIGAIKLINHMFQRSV